MSCAWFGYNAKAPAFERVAYDATAPHTTALLSRSPISVIGIDSASRCVPEMTTYPNQTTVSFETNECIVGFECCDTNKTVCSCPANSSQQHASLYEGAFDGSCYPTVTSWPKCEQQCVDMGSECQYYLRRHDSDECLLCYAYRTQVLSKEDSNVDEQQWSYHVVQTPTVSAEDPMARTDAEGRGWSFRHQQGSMLLTGDASLSSQGNWYSVGKSRLPGHDSVCVPGYVLVAYNQSMAGALRTCQ